VTDSYTEQLERRCEQLQEQLTSLHSGIANFFRLKIVVEKKKTELYLETMTPKRCDQKEGDIEFATPPATSNTISLCVAVNTTVDEVKKWYLEFCDGSRGYCDSTLKPQELGLIIAKKFSLVYVPIEVIIKDPAHADYKGGDFLDVGYIYAPYVPMNFWWWYDPWRNSSTSSS